MLDNGGCVCGKRVALRKESVDRNLSKYDIWVAQYSVALRKESVDRNPAIKSNVWPDDCRSPQGERG